MILINKQFVQWKMTLYKAIPLLVRHFIVVVTSYSFKIILDLKVMPEQ